MHNGPEVYGVLLGLIGVGSILGSFALNGLKARLGPNRLAGLGTIGTILALALYAAARHPAIAGVASVVAGASWITMMTTLFVSAQVALPEWVRGRGLAIFLTVFFGAMTLGSAVWGKVASMWGLSTTLDIAAAGAAVAMILTLRWRLQSGAALDLTPSMHWRTPVFVHPVEDDEGPILLTVEYRIDPKDRGPFLALMHEIGLERKRDGAYAWGVFEDTEVSGRIVETFLIQSLLELRHMRTRVTVADRMIMDRASAFLTEERKVTYLVAPKRHRHARRKGSGRLAPPQEAAEPVEVG
jgi:MFS family permease